MKTPSKYKAYFRTVLFSVAAAFIIDAVINYDDFRRSFDTGRGKITVMAHSTSDSIFKTPEKVALITGLLYSTFFE